MKLKTAKKILKILNKIESLEDLKEQKKELKEFIKVESEKPNIIIVKWVGCYELMKDGTKSTYYNDVFEFIEDELNQSAKDVESARKIINNYCKLNRLEKYSLKDIKLNNIEDVINHYWENCRETMSFEVEYK